MEDKFADDIRYDLEPSKDGRKITLTFTSEIPMSTADLVCALEELLLQVTRAHTQREALGQLVQ